MAPKPKALTRPLSQVHRPGVEKSGSVMLRRGAWVENPQRVWLQGEQEPLEDLVGTLSV